VPRDRETSALIKRVHSLFVSRRLTLAVAESCTAGQVSYYVTSLPGASAFFTGGLITYSVAMKRELLGVSSETLDRFGAVSEQTAREMAERVRVLCRSDWGLGTTGNLGPDVLEGKERGLVYIAVASEAGTVTRELLLKGSRDENKHAAAFSVLRVLVEAVKA
jgi:PncC family amidohydrolase